ARLVLVGRGSARSDALEAGLSEAASAAVALVGAGAGAPLAGPGVHVRLGPGRPHLRRVLAALALYDPDGSPAADDISAAEAPASPDVGRPGRRLREIRIPLRR